MPVCRVLAAVLGLSLLLLAPVVGPVAGVPAAAAPGATVSKQVPAADTPVQVHLASVTPAVATPGSPVTLTGTVRNTGGEPVPRPVLRVRVSDRGLDTRDRVAAWADGSDTGPAGSERARVSLGRALGPGASRSFRLRIKGDAIHPGLSFGTLPMTVDLLEGPAPRIGGKHRGASGTGADGPVDGSLRTFLPWNRGGDYKPVDISWVMPLTLPPDVALFSTDPRERAVAWQDAIGPGSSIDALLTGTAGAQVTYLLDQGLVTPQLPPSPSGASSSPSSSGTRGASGSGTSGGASGSGPTSRQPSGTATPSSTDPGSPASGPTSTATAGSPGSRARSGGTGSSGTSSSGHSTGPTGSSTSGSPAGPTGSGSPSPTTSSPAQLNAGVARLAADLATRLRGTGDHLWALPYADPDLGAVLPLDAAHPTLQQAMSLPVPTSLGNATPGVAWPVSLRLDPKAVKRLRQAYAVRGGLTAAIASRSTVAGDDTRTGLAAHKTPSGLPVLAYDDRLSAIVNDATSRIDGGTSVQRFLAETMAIYQQRPAANRSLLVAPPRGFRADPHVLRTLLTQARDAPWLASTPAPTLLQRARRAKPDASPPAAPATTQPTHPGGPTYPSPGGSPLSARRLLHLTFQQLRIDGLASILTDHEDRAAQWTDTEKQLLSTRWRGAGPAWTTLADQAERAITTLRRGIHVAPANVNFLADAGSLQVTVVNDLDVDVHDVRLRLVPGTPQLRITAQPGPLHIAAHSRTSVRVHVTALGAGDVPIDAQLTTPNGTSLGSAPRVSVHVQPTGTWIYWVVGIVAGLILALGLFRTLRRGSAHRPAPPGEETTEP